MVKELSYEGKAAAGYDGAFAQVTTHFAPFLLRAAHITPGMRILDIATGTGLAAEAALSVVGSAGHVTAADLSPAMAEKARARLDQARNASVTVEDGQALSFLDGSFDAVVCSLGLMFFPDPQRGLTEFHRVLRPGGRAAVSVSTVPERSYNTRISLSIARYLPSLAEAAARVSSLGDEMKLKSLFEAANFRDVRFPRKLTASRCLPLTLTSRLSSKVRGHPDRHSFPSLTQPAVPCARKYGGIFAILADQSR